MLQLVCCNVLQRERQQIDYVRRKPWVCRGVLQCVAVCCSVLEYVAVCCIVIGGRTITSAATLSCVVVCCSVLQCVAICFSVVQCDWRQIDCVSLQASGMLQYVAVAVWCIMLQLVCCNVIGRRSTTSATSLRCVADVLWQ